MPSWRREKLCQSKVKVPNHFRGLVRRVQMIYWSLPAPARSSLFGFDHQWKGKGERMLLQELQNMWIQVIAFLQMGLWFSRKKLNDDLYFADIMNRHELDISECSFGCPLIRFSAVDLMRFISVISFAYSNIPIKYFRNQARVCRMKKKRRWHHENLTIRICTLSHPS